MPRMRHGGPAAGRWEIQEEFMSKRDSRRGLGRNRGNSSINSSKTSTRRAIDCVLERLEERRLLSGDVRLVGITGNQQNPDYLDETLYDIKYGSSGSTDKAFMDGFEDIASNAPDTKLSISTTVGVTEGKGALRVDVPQDQNAYW